LLKISHYLAPYYVILCITSFLLVLVTDIYLFFCFLLCVFCVFVLFLLCVLFLLLCCSFPIFIQVSRPLPPGGNPVAVNKYQISYFHMCCVLRHPSVCIILRCTSGNLNCVRCKVRRPCHKLRRLDADHRSNCCLSLQRLFFLRIEVLTM
jgi:hypothetical protein